MQLYEQSTNFITMITFISTSLTLTVILRQNMLAIQNFLSKIKLPQFFLSSKNIVFLGLVLALTACKSVQTATNSTSSHATSQLQRDSIYLHDSIRVEYRRGNLFNSSHLSHSLSERSVFCPGVEAKAFPHPLSDALMIKSPDTIIVEKWHTAYKDRIVQHTDTIQIETTKTETVQVRYVPRFYKYCAALTALLLLFLLIKFTLWLYKRIL